MPQVQLSRQSRADLRDILVYIRLYNRSAARRLLDRIDAVFERLAEFPRLGATRPELGHNLRSIPVGVYLIFYRPMPGGIHVVRVLHGARDLRRIFRKR